MIWNDNGIKQEEKSQSKSNRLPERIENSIYFYEDIDSVSILSLVKTISFMDNDFTIEQINRGKSKPDHIVLHVNSNGGSLWQGLLGMDAILKCKSDVHTCIDGTCCSAATFLTIVGKYRTMRPHSVMLIHEVTSVMWGKYSEFIDNQKNLDLAMKMIKDAYSKYTKVPKKKLNEILKHDLYFEPKQCLEYGLIDEIV